MNEEHTSIAPSAEQAENERDARAEELQSTFSYDGSEVRQMDGYVSMGVLTGRTVPDTGLD